MCLCSPSLPAPPGMLRLSKETAKDREKLALSGEQPEQLLILGAAASCCQDPWCGKAVGHGWDFWGSIWDGGGGWFLDYFVLFLFSFLTQHKAIDLQSGCIVVVIYDNCGCRFVRSSIFFFLNIKIV